MVSMYQKITYGLKHIVKYHIKNLKIPILTIYDQIREKSTIFMMSHLFFGYNSKSIGLILL